MQAAAQLARLCFVIDKSLDCTSEATAQGRGNSGLQPQVRTRGTAAAAAAAAADTFLTQAAYWLPAASAAAHYTSNF